MQANQLNQEENEDLLYNRGHYYGASSNSDERFDAVVLDDDSEDWRDKVRKHIISENKKTIEPQKSYFKLGLM